MAKRRKKLFTRFLPDDLNIGRFLGPSFFAIAVFYLAFHAFNGERGLYAYLKQSRNLETTQVELTAVKTEREALEHQVKLMSDQSLSLDMLDEQARRVLGEAKESEIVVFVE